MLDELQAALAAIAGDPALHEEQAFAARAAALDALEVHVVDRLDALAAAAGESPALAALRRSAERLRRRLEAADRRLFRRLRAEIRAGALRGAALRDVLVTCVGPGDDEGGYDSLDSFVNGLLGVAGVPEETRAREPEMVAYYKTPARVVLRVIELTGLAERDVFYDLGSGLGHAPMLAHLLAGARAVGVEVEPAYCAAARASARGLALAGVTFVQADARAVPYDDGTVFFLYSPFTGAMLQAVLDRLRDEARRRPISVAAFGPCLPALARQPWLTRAHTHDDSAGELAVFDGSDKAIKR